MGKPVEFSEKPDRVEATAAGFDTERLMKELGQGKPFHLMNYALLTLTVYTAAIYGINYVFLAADVDYR